MKAEAFREAILQVHLIARLPKALREKTADLLVDISVPRSVPKGGTWLHEGEHSENKGYILVKGAVAIQKASAPDLRCEAPELLGEAMQFSTTGLRTATVATIEDCIVLRFMWEEFWAAVEDEFSFAEQTTLKEAIKDLAWEHFTG